MPFVIEIVSHKFNFYPVFTTFCILYFHLISFFNLIFLAPPHQVNCSTFKFHYSRKVSTRKEQLLLPALPNAKRGQERLWYISEPCMVYSAHTATAPRPHSLKEHTQLMNEGGPVKFFSGAIEIKRPPLVH